MNLLNYFLLRGRSSRTILSGVFAGIRRQLEVRQGQMLIWTGLYGREIVSDVRRLAQGCRLVIDLGYQTKIIIPAWWRIILPTHQPIPHNRWLSASRPNVPPVR